MDDTLFDYPEGSGDVVASLEKLFKLGLQCRLPFETKALQSLLFWAGDHWTSLRTDFSRRTGRIIEHPAGCNASRIVDNQIPIYVRQISSMGTSAISDFEARAATSETADKEAAALATRFIKMREHLDDEEGLREEEFLWAIGSGEVLRRVWFNTSKQSRGGIQGDLDTEVINIFRYVKCPSDAGKWPPRWLVEFDARNVDWVKEAYGQSVEPEAVADNMRAIDDLAMNVLTDRSAPRDEEKSSVLLKRLYAQPSSKYPKGHVWVWANGVLLKHHDFQGDTFPFACFGWYPIPGRLYPMSYLEPLLSDQKQLNTLLSQINEVKTRQLRNDLLLQTGGQGPFAMPQEKVIDEKTGQKAILIPPGATSFELMKYDTNLTAAEADYQRIMKNLHDKGGLAEPTLGQVTGRKTTLGELTLLREAGMQSIAYHMRRFDRYCAEVAQMKIALAKEFYAEARMVTDLGGESSGETTYFFGADFRDTRDVVPVPTPHMTPAMKRQAVAEAASAGLFGPYTDKSGTPNIFVQYAARTQLRMMGLVEEDDRIAQDFGSYEELGQIIGQVTQVARQIQLLALARQAQQALMPQTLQQPGSQPQMTAPDPSGTPQMGPSPSIAQPGEGEAPNAEPQAPPV